MLVHIIRRMIVGLMFEISIHCIAFVAVKLSFLTLSVCRCITLSES